MAIVMIVVERHESECAAPFPVWDSFEQYSRRQAVGTIANFGPDREGSGSTVESREVT